jgi:hypothetical protein
MPLTFSSAAAQGFSRLLDLYGTYNTPHKVNDETTYLFDKNFWFAGNALHAMVDYLLNAELPNKKDMTEKVLTMGVGAYKKYSREFTDRDWWRDDYAWWGNAFLLILHNRRPLDLSQDLFDQLHKSAQFCWGKLTENWHDDPYGDSDNAADSNSNVKGGVFNVYKDETAGDMEGRNSVTNEGYWLLSQGLSKLQPEQKKYSARAEQMQAWFDQWLDAKNSSFKKPGLRDSRGLVLERPMGNKADPAWCWTGDQGLLFRALTNVGDEKAEAAGEIAKATFHNLSVLDNRIGYVLHEYLPPGRRGFMVDYATGKGIFLRSLVCAGVKPSNCPYAANIKSNADAVWLNRLNKETNQFSYNWAGAEEPEPLQLFAQGTKSQDLCDLVMQASGLDALNAAMLIAPSELIPDS